MAKIPLKLKKIIIIILNSAYLAITLWTLLILYEYIYDIYSNFSRFKIMHSPTVILRDIAAILLWVIFSMFIYKYNKNSISQNKSVIIYSVIPFAVLLIVYLIFNVDI